ncbi:MAG: hypothetical protein Q7S95_01940 [bacterium]|nr:hypothetical protein [bacterium]
MERNLLMVILNCIVFCLFGMIGGMGLLAALLPPELSGVSPSVAVPDLQISVVLVLVAALAVANVFWGPRPKPVPWSVHP